MLGFGHAKLKACAGKPYSITRFDDIKTGRHIITVLMKDVSDRTAILAGDCVHNLRCALDHAVFSLAVYATGTIPGTRLQWPVLETPNDKTLKHQTAGLPAGAFAIIESLQPYHMGPADAFKRSPFWQLHKLDIIDKHRLPPVAAVLEMIPDLSPGVVFRRRG